MEQLKNWMKPRANQIAAAAAEFHQLEQGTDTLAEHIDKATILCDRCEYEPEDAKKRLLRDAIVIGLRS